MTDETDEERLARPLAATVEEQSGWLLTRSGLMPFKDVPTFGPDDRDRCAELLGSAFADEMYGWMERQRAQPSVIRIISSTAVPEDEAHFTQDGKLVGRIVNIGSKP